MSIYDLDLPTRIIIGLVVIIFTLQGFKRWEEMSECNNDCSQCEHKTFDSDSSFEFICNIDGHIVEVRNDTEKLSEI